jgi:xanthine dehydrogenase iron-sulfur cluster and FAD-binding subunit A
MSKLLSHGRKLFTMSLSTLRTLLARRIFLTLVWGCTAMAATVTLPSASIIGITTTSEVRSTPEISAESSCLNNGASPKGHIYVARAARGFDLHYPQTLAEVTALISKTAITVSGQTLTVNFAQLNPVTATLPAIIAATKYPFKTVKASQTRTNGN